MSLIIEALKRARDDAIRRQAAARGLPLASVPRFRGRSPWLAIAIVPLAAALVICVLLLVDLYSRLSHSAEPPPTTVAAPPASSSPALPEETEEDAPVGAAVEVRAPAESVTLAASDPGPSTVDRTSDLARDPVPEPTPTEPPPSDSTPSPAIGSETATPSGAERVFVGQARLPNEQVIDLGGIAWSESEPYALLNGQVVGVGELIRTYRVVEITRSQVVLESDDDRIVLRLD